MLFLSHFQVLQLDNQLDVTKIEKLPEDYNIDQKINDFVASITLKNVRLLDETTKRNIEKLGQSNLNDFEYYKFVDNVGLSSITFKSHIIKMFFIILAYDQYNSVQPDFPR